MHLRGLRFLLLGLFTSVTLVLSHPLAQAGEGEAKPAAGAVYLRLKPITFSVIGPDNRISRQIGILLQLQLAAGKTAEQGETFRRQIEDKFLLTLTELWDQRPVDAPPLPAETIKTKLREVATVITGPGVIDGLYIQELSERAR